MKILLVTQWFDPEPTFKGILFAKSLQKHGHEVEVLTGFPNYPGGKVYAGYSVKGYERETVDGITVHRVYLYPSHDGSGRRRVLNYASFAIAAAWRALLVRRPDVAYVYHPPATVSLPAFVLRTLRGVPFVYDVQDLWPDSLSATGMVSSKRVLAAVQWCMSRVYARAARVVVLSNGFRRILQERGTHEGGVDVVPNWADEAQIDLTAEPYVLPDPGFHIVFAGNMGTVQALGTVLDAAEILEQEQPAIRFVLVGGGVDAERLRESAAKRDLSNVTFLPRRPISDMGPVLAAADALLVHLKDDPLFAVTIPSKTQAYLMAGKPILMGVRGDAEVMVSDAGAGLSFTPEDPRSLATAATRLYTMTREQRDGFGAAGTAYYRTNLSLEVGSARFSAILRRASYLKPRTLTAKRVMDVIVSAVGLIVLSVPIAILALAIRIVIGGPVLFRQSRPGKNGRLFTMLKFRTMTDARGEDGELLLDKFRLTRFGAFLRRASLDELPELVNVLRGDMSIVGPRPLLTRYTRYFTEEEEERLLVRPGVTGWAQVNGRNLASWDRRLGMDVWYVRNLSVALDLKILALTIARVVRSQGVVVDPETVMQNLDDERRGRERL
jgi:lipopolysaccharide/colanic/teichoic acid biosynthesis glycosyltransferase/UDP-N-acetylglucosamine:LPS N-acetylglucosamine transferase